MFSVATHSPQETVDGEGSPETRPTAAVAVAAAAIDLSFPWLLVAFDDRVIVVHLTFHSIELILLAVILQFPMTLVMVLQQPALHELPYRLHVTE